MLCYHGFLVITYQVIAVAVGDNINAAKVTQSAVYPLFILEYAEKIYTRKPPSIFESKCSVVKKYLVCFSCN